MPGGHGGLGMPVPPRPQERQKKLWEWCAFPEVSKPAKDDYLGDGWLQMGDVFEWWWCEFGCT